MRPELEQAVNVIREQRPEALDQALGLLQDTVLAYSMKVCGHRDDAEDTAQEVLIRAARQLPGFDNPMALSVWLYKVARTQCLMSRRRSKFAPEHELPLDEAPDVSESADRTQTNFTPEQVVIGLEDAERILVAIRKLPDTYRIVLTLHDLEELENPEIARALDTSEGAIRVRLHRARKLLKESLQQSVPAGGGDAF